MSIIAMADNHVLAESAKEHREARAAAGGGGAAPDPGTPVGVDSNVVNQLTMFIPTEVITLWVAFIAAVHSPKAPMGKDICQANFGRLWYPAIAFALLASLMVWGFAHRKWADTPPPAGHRRKRFRLPWFEMVAAPLAFGAWVVALPESPLRSACWYSTEAGAGIVIGATVLITSAGYVFGKTQRFQKTAAS